MIVLLQLSTGVEIAGEWDAACDVHANNLLIKRPLQLNYKYFVGGAPTINFSRYMMFGKTDTITFNTSFIVNKIEARDHFVSVYQKHAEYYYNHHQKSIDEELQNSAPSEDEHLLNMLKMMPIENEPIN